MSTAAVQVFIAVFGGEHEAKEALRDFQAANSEGSLDLIDAAVIVRTADDKLEIEEAADPDGRRMGKRGLLVGGLVGLIFPPSLVVSAVVGGGAGAIWGKLRDKGFTDGELKDVGDSMEPGTSAIVAIAQERVVEQLQAGLAGYQRIARHGLSAEAAIAVSGVQPGVGDADEPTQIKVY